MDMRDLGLNGVVSNAWERERGRERERERVSTAEPVPQDAGRGSALARRTAPSSNLWQRERVEVVEFGFSGSRSRTEVCAGLSWIWEFPDFRTRNQDEHNGIGCSIWLLRARAATKDTQKNFDNCCRPLSLSGGRALQAFG